MAENSGSGSRKRARARTGTEPEQPEQLVAPAADDTGTTTIIGVDGSRKELTYAKVGDLAVFEGDIILGNHADLAPSGAEGDVASGVGITGQQFRWPNALVPYEIDPAMPNQFRVTDAIAHWVAKTPIRFVQRTAANAGQYPNYVHFFQGNGCYSTVGMSGVGRQDISLGSSCGTGNAIHEIGHTVGLWHEQSREDRNSFVTVMYANIVSDKVYNFDQHITDGDDIGPYDYGSIMHYPWNAFAIDGTKPTLVPTHPGVTIGQRIALSDGDIAAVKHMYPTAVPPFKKVLDDGGGFKKIVDDSQSHHFKKIVDDPIKAPKSDILKPAADPQQHGGWGQVVLPPEQLGRFGQVLRGAGDLPFVLATPHHAAAAAGYGGGTSGDPSTDLLAAASTATATAAQALSELAAILQALSVASGGTA